MCCLHTKYVCGRREQEQSWPEMLLSGPHLVSSACTADPQSHGSPIAHVGIVALRQQRHHARTLLWSPRERKKKPLFIINVLQNMVSPFCSYLKISNCSFTHCFFISQSLTKGKEQMENKLINFSITADNHTQLPLLKSSLVLIFCL